MAKKKTWKSTAAGAIAGGIETVCIWPSEYTKTLLQLQNNKNNKQYNGMIDCGIKQIKKYGPTGVYRGLSSALLFSIPKAALRFGSFNYYHNTLSNNTDMSSNKITFCSGLLSGATEAIFVVTPQDTIKTKLIELNTGFSNGIKNIIKNEGISGLYKGVYPTIIKQSTNQAIRFSTFAIYKNYMLNKNEKELSSSKALIGGMTSGGISVLFNNPFDVVKTRMQGLESNKYKSLGDCFRKTLVNEGIPAFYKGIVPRLFRVVPGQGIIFASYEKIFNLINRNF